MTEPPIISNTVDPHASRQLLAVSSGDLASTPFAKLLLAAALLERTLVIELRRNALFKKVIIDAGVPVECESNIATESLGRYLVAQGRLTETAFQASLSQSVARGVPLEEVLVERQLIPAADVFKLLQQNLGRKLLDAFSWLSGSYRIAGEQPVVESALRVRVPQLILTGMLRFEPQERVDETLRRMSGRALVLNDEGPFRVDDLRLASEHAAMLKTISERGVWSRDLKSADGTTEEMHRFAHALFTLGLVAIAEAPAARKVPQAPPVEEIVAPPPAVRQAPLLSVDELMTAYLSFRRKDALELLDLPENVGIVQINRAWMDFARRFLPWQFPDEGDGLREKAQEIFLYGARAYGELADPDRRAAVIARRRAAEEEKSRSAREQAPVEREKLVDPEDLYRKGRELAAKGRTREALSYFEMAADCDAQNGTYAAELAWSRFELMITTATLTMKALKNALRVDPRSGAAHLYVGLIHSTMGNHLEAEGYVLKAAELMPRDPRIAEALRQIRSRR